jgi:UrcA family protein
MKTMLFGLAAVALLGAPASAEPMADAPTVVRFADLNLTDVRDAGILLDRLERAAGQVCTGDGAQPRGTTQRQAYRACREDVVRRAVARLKAPELARQYAQALEERDPVRTAGVR